MELALELIEYFLLVPAMFVNEHEREGWQGEFVGDVGVGFSVSKEVTDLTIPRSHLEFGIEEKVFSFDSIRFPEMFIMFWL